MAAAVTHYQRALETRPDNVMLLNRAGWILATDRNPMVRNASSAVKLTEHAVALTARGDVELLDTLAAALAEAGRFDEATAGGGEAMQIAAGLSPTAGTMTRVTHRTGPMHRMLLALACTVLGGAFAIAQSSTPARVETPHLVITTSASDRPAGGRKVTLFVDVAPKPRMHVYAPEEKGYLSVSLTVSRQDGLTPQKSIFPRGESFFFAPTQETQIVYSRPFRIEQPIVLSPTTLRKGGTMSVSATLLYQACDDKVCYIPRKVPLTWTLSIGGPASNLQ